MAFLAVGGVSSMGHGSDCHDDQCALITLTHDPSAHRIGTIAPDPSHPLHCVLCHWMRSVRPSTEPVHHLARPVSDDVRVHTEVRGVVSLVQAAQPPLRSPPSRRH
jgi:hypothetical protein